MSFFNDLLDQRGISPNSVKSIQQIIISEQEFETLSIHIKETPYLARLDPRDASLYYAFWWRYLYSGGTPSKEKIYESLELNTDYGAEDFYKHARKGAEKIGIAWIRRQNKLYFRTLLSQGGLPLKHIESGNNYDSYTRFLLKLQKKNPDSEADIESDYFLVKLLPKSMRNEYVYRSSLDLIKSINSDEHYGNLEEKLRILLRNNNQNQNEQRTRKTSLKADWILKKQEDTYIVLLATNEPGSMDAKSFKNLSRELKNMDDHLANHYNLFVGDYLLCSFYKNIGGKYSLTWSNSTMVRWNNEDILPEVFLMDSKGNSYRVDNLITHLPSTSQPNYWGKRSEDEYILEKSTKTTWEEALLTFPDGFSSEKEQTEIIINGVELQAIEVEDSETLIYNETGETKEFKTNAQSFDFQIITDILPQEIIKSNLHVVKNTISRIYVFKKGGDENEVDDDDDEKTFEARKIEYSKDKINWKTLKRKEFLPYGLLYLRIHFGNMMEEAVVFNIGNLEIQNQDATTDSATISFHSRADFSIEPKPNELWDIKKNQQWRI